MLAKFKIRKRFIPRTGPDAASLIFVILMIPLTYWFELFVVLPTSYPMWSAWFITHLICGTFILTNIVSNLMAVVVVDTSTKGEMMPSTLKPNWHFCAVCEAVAPPRAWHCNTCGTCILKREHHCMFSGCCIGHYNYRYFIFFLFYLWIATTYATYFNNYFIWKHFDSKTTPYDILRIVFPLAMIVFGVEFTIHQLHILLYVVNFAGVVLTSVLLFFHVRLIMKGTTTYEHNEKIKDYDLGTTQNIMEVLGEKWYLSWISPFLESKLPQNGIEWLTRSSWATESRKNY